jgi:hypothetical protein
VVLVLLELFNLVKSSWNRVGVEKDLRQKGQVSVLLEPTNVVEGVHDRARQAFKFERIRIGHLAKGVAEGEGERERERERKEKEAEGRKGRWEVRGKEVELEAG